MIFLKQTISSPWSFFSIMRFCKSTFGVIVRILRLFQCCQQMESCPAYTKCYLTRRLPAFD